MLFLIQNKLGQVNLNITKCRIVTHLHSVDHQHQMLKTFFMFDLCFSKHIVYVRSTVVVPCESSLAINWVRCCVVKLTIVVGCGYQGCVYFFFYYFFTSFLLILLNDVDEQK